ncbi:MAG: hypothetical protein IPL32_15325 [Chloracidobacterium sp.]|nr:hypothetical protein [Chloracidobacterium sp.]
MALKTANPKLTSQEFAEAANRLLEKNGIGFVISFDAATCEKIKNLKDQQKDPNVPIKLGATLKSVDAEGASLVLPEPHITAAECGGCYIELPILEITDKAFVTVVEGRNIKFQLPSNFYSNEAVLLDSKDKTTIKRKWRIPFRSIPIGVSYDENVLYLGFDDSELSQLSLSVFGEGVLQITTREEAENGGKGKIIEAPSSSATTSPNQVIRFDRWKNIYLVSIKKPCPR